MHFSCFSKKFSLLDIFNAGTVNIAMFNKFRIVKQEFINYLTLLFFNYVFYVFIVLYQPVKEKHQYTAMIITITYY